MSRPVPPVRDASGVQVVAVAAATCFHAFVLGIYPALVVISTNAGVLPLNARAIVRTLSVSVALVAVALVLLKPLLPALRDRAFWISCFLLGFNLYPALRPFDSDATYAAPGVAAYCSEQNAELETLSYTSKALPAPVGVKRWTLYREP